MELKYIVYITVNLLNGKFYIGVHRTNPDVFDGYIGNDIYNQNCATQDYTLHKAVRKYGYENFKRTTIEIFPDTPEGKKAALQLEKQIVTKTLIKSKSCYNMVVGGCGGEREVCNKKVYMFALNGNFLRSFKNTRNAAEYVYNKIKESSIDIIRAGIKNNCRGITQSCCNFYFSYTKEFRYENKTVKKVAQYTYAGKFLRYYDSITEASVLFNCDVYQAILKKGTAGGYQWRYYDNNCDNIDPIKNYTTKNSIFPIVMFNTKERFEYDNINECIKNNPDFSASQINRVLSGKIKKHRGYSFKYKDEDIV